MEDALILFLKETVRLGRIPFDYTEADLEEARRWERIVNDDVQDTGGEETGVAQLVGRDIWDVEVGCSSHLTRTKIPLKSTISEGFFLFFVYCGAGFEVVILNTFSQ